MNWQSSIVPKGTEPPKVGGEWLQVSRPETGDLARQWAGEGTGSVSQRQGDPQPAAGERGLRRLRVSTFSWRRWGQRKGRRESGGRGDGKCRHLLCAGHWAP